MSNTQIIQGDCLDILPTLEENSIQCCITSPPYWGLRDYGVEGQLGLEETPEEYVKKLVAVFREVKRVLRKDGTLWLNLGDSYSGGGRGGDPKHLKGDNSAAATMESYKGIPAKNLIGIPWKVAFALQGDGWVLRQDIIWSKTNPMPESVTDRCTKSHEYIFLLTKSAKYFYDNEAIKEEANYDGRKDTVMKGSDKYADGFVPNQSPHTFHQRGHERWQWDNGIAYRNRRSVWTINTTPYKEAHFATFPPELPTLCIKAGSSEKGCCPECGSPWVREVNHVASTSTSCPKEQSAHEARGGIGIHTGTVGKSGGGRKNGHSETIGWTPTCVCNAAYPGVPCAKDDPAYSPYPPIPCTILDPFAGAGTVGYVCEKLDRKFIGIELNPQYIKMAEDRIYNVQPLFAGLNL